MSMMEPQYALTHVIRDMWQHLSRLVSLERRILWIIGSYAVAIGLLFLCVPIAVQELVSTFSFAMEPRMVLTLAAMVLVALLGVAYFRERQARAVETFQQRVYARITLAFAEQLPRINDDTFVPQHANRFFEAELLTRALVAMVADLFNVAVAGTIAVGMLTFFSPFFLVYLGVLLVGFVALLVLFGRGGFQVTLKMSQLNYQLFNWMQNLALNLPHLRAVASQDYVMARTDDLLLPYVRTRQARSDTLTGRQYKATAVWQAFGHSGMIVTAGLLVVDGQITVGQFAGAEVLVGNLLLHMDTFARRMVAIFFMFTSMRELAGFFALPKATGEAHLLSPSLLTGAGGVRLTCRQVSFAYPGSAPLFEELDFDVAPGEKMAILCQTSTVKTALAKVLAGLYHPTTGTVRYNDVNLVETDQDSINRCRALMLDSLPTLLDGTLEDNISVGRPGITYQDLTWAIRFAEIEEEVDALPQGIKTVVSGHGKTFTLSQTLRILLARAIVTRPQLLIFDGTLHSMPLPTREVLLRRLCAKDEPWSVVFASNDPSFIAHVDRYIRLPDRSARRPLL